MGRFKAGEGGRPKGAVNKRTRVLAALEKSGVCPFQYMFDRMNDTEENPGIRLQCAKELCEYLEPKLSRAEVKTEVENVTNGIDYSKLPLDTRRQISQLIHESTHPTIEPDEPTLQ